MTAVSEMSTEELLAAYQGGGSDAPAVDLSAVPTEELMAAYKDPSLLGKIGRFARKVYENPPPTIAGIRDIMKGAPEAAQALRSPALGGTASPAEQEAAAGRMFGAAMLGTPLPTAMRGGEGVLGAPQTGLLAREMQPGMFGYGSMPAPRLSPAPPPSATTVPAQAAVEAAGRQNVPLPRFMAGEGTAIPQFAGAIRNVPWAGEPIVRAAAQLPRDIGARVSELAPASTPAVAGEAARGGVANWIKTGSQGPVSAAYKEVDRLVDPAVRVPLDNTAAIVSEILAERTAARLNSRSKAVDMVLGAVQSPNAMDYAGTKYLRTAVFEKTPQELAIQGIDKREFARIRGALTKDLTAVVRESSPEALAAWQEANTLARLTAKQREALVNVVGREGEATPETVFARLVRYADNRTTSDLRRLQLAKNAMGSEAWGEVGSALISRIGRAPDGTFSPDRFVTAYGNLSPAGRGLLFGAEQHAALNDMMTLSMHARDRITRFSNPSGTARGVSGLAAASGALFADPTLMIASMLGTRMAAEAMARPAVVRAANAVSRAAQSGNQAATSHRLQQAAARHSNGRPGRRRGASAGAAAARRAGLAGHALPSRRGRRGVVRAGRAGDDRAERADAAADHRQQAARSIIAATGEPVWRARDAGRSHGLSVRISLSSSRSHITPIIPIAIAATGTILRGSQSVSHAKKKKNSDTAISRPAHMHEIAFLVRLRLGIGPLHGSRSSDGAVPQASSRCAL